MPNISNITAEETHGPFSAAYALPGGQVGFVSTATDTLGFEPLAIGTPFSTSLDLRNAGAWASNVDQLHEFTGGVDATLTLPALSQVADGEGIAFQTSLNASRLQVSPAGAETLPGGFSSSNHLVLNPNSFLRIIRLNGAWVITTLLVQAPVQQSAGPDNPNPGDLITGATLSLRNERFNPNSVAGFPLNAVYGYAYIVSQSGTFDSVSFSAGDLIIAIRPAPVSTTAYENNWVKVAGTSTLASWGGVTANHIDDTMIRGVLERIGFFTASQAGQDLVGDVVETNERSVGSVADGAIRIGRRGLADIDRTFDTATFGQRPFTATSDGEYSIFTVVVPASIPQATSDTYLLVTTREQPLDGGGVGQVVQEPLTLHFDRDFEIHHDLSDASFRVYESIQSHQYRANDSVDVRDVLLTRRLALGNDTRVSSDSLPTITRANLDPADVVAFTATGASITNDEQALFNQLEVSRDAIPNEEVPADSVTYKAGGPSDSDSDYFPYSVGNGILQYGHSTASYSIRSLRPVEVRDVQSANADSASIAVTQVSSHFPGYHEYTVTLPAYTVGGEGIGSAIIRGGVRTASIGFSENVTVDRENLSPPLVAEIDAAADSYRPDETQSRFIRDLTVSYESHDFTELAAHPFPAGFAFQPIAVTLSGPNRDDVTDPHNGSGGNEYIRPLAPGEEPPSISPVQAHFAADGTYTYFPDSHDVSNIEFPGYNSFFQGAVRIANKAGQNAITGTETKIAVSLAYSLPEDLSGDPIDLLQFGASSPTLRLVPGSGLELKRGAPGGTQIQVFYDSPLRTVDNAQQGSVTLVGAGATAQIDFVTPLNAARNHNYDPELQLLEQRHLTTGVQQAAVYHVGDPRFSQVTAQRFTYSFPDPAGGSPITVFADHTYLANEITQDGVTRSIIRVVLSGASTTDRLDFAGLIKEQLSTTGNNSTFQRDHHIGPSDGTDSVAHNPIALSLLFGPTQVGDISQNPLMSVSVIRDHVHLTDPDNGSHWIDLGVRRSDLQWNPTQVAGSSTGITVGGPRVRISQVQLGTWNPSNRVTKRPLPSQYFDATVDHQPYYGQYTAPGERSANWTLAGNLALIDSQGNARQLQAGAPSRVVFDGVGVPNSGGTVLWPDDFDPTEYSEFRVEIAHVSGGSIFGNSGYVTMTVPTEREFAIGNNFMRGVITQEGFRSTAGTPSSAARLFIIFRR